MISNCKEVSRATVCLAVCLVSVLGKCEGARKMLFWNLWGLRTQDFRCFALVWIWNKFLLKANQNMNCFGTGHRRVYQFVHPLLKPTHVLLVLADGRMDRKGRTPVPPLRIRLRCVEQHILRLKCIACIAWHSVMKVSQQPIKPNLDCLICFNG